MTRITTFFLAFIIAVTSQQMAMSRGLMKDAAGQVVLCTGQGVQTITVDHQGQPIDIVHICPECALTFMAPMDVPTAVETPFSGMRTLCQTPVPAVQTVLTPTNVQPRGPPQAV